MITSHLNLDSRVESHSGMAPVLGIISYKFMESKKSETGNNSYLCVIVQLLFQI